MEFENIINLIQAVSESNLTQFSYENDDVKIKMKTDKEKTVVSCIPPMAVPSVTPAGMDFSAMALPQTGAGVLPQAETQQAEISGNTVKSPLVGTFYASASPDDQPFVNVGDTVAKGQVLGIVEAMKLMNEIESDFAGVVKEILVSNGDVIEFGQPMFVIG